MTQLQAPAIQFNKPRLEPPERARVEPPAQDRSPFRDLLTQRRERPLADILTEPTERADLPERAGAQRLETDETRDRARDDSDAGTQSRPEPRSDERPEERSETSSGPERTGAPAGDQDISPDPSGALPAQRASEPSSSPQPPAGQQADRPQDPRGEPADPQAGPIEDLDPDIPPREPSRTAVPIDRPEGELIRPGTQGEFEAQLPARGTPDAEYVTGSVSGYEDAELIDPLRNRASDTPQQPVPDGDADLPPQTVQQPPSSAQRASETPVEGQPVATDPNPAGASQPGAVGAGAEPNSRQVQQPVQAVARSPETSQPEPVASQPTYGGNRVQPQGLDTPVQPDAPRQSQQQSQNAEPVSSFKGFTETVRENAVAPNRTDSDQNQRESAQQHRADQDSVRQRDAQHQSANQQHASHERNASTGQQHAGARADAPGAPTTSAAQSVFKVEHADAQPAQSQQPGAPATSSSSENSGVARPSLRGAETPTLARNDNTQQTPAENARLTAQVARGLAAALQQKGGSVTLRLQPEELGQLRIQMSITGGRVSATFEASSEEAGKALRSSIDSLRSSLESRGLQVDRLDVSSTRSESEGGAGRHADRNQQQWGGSVGNQASSWQGQNNEHAGHGSSESHADDARSAPGTAGTQDAHDPDQTVTNEPVRRVETPDGRVRLTLDTVA